MNQFTTAPAMQAGTMGSGNIALPNFIGDTYVPVTLNSASGTTPVTLITGKPGYYVTRLFVEVDPTCTQTTAGMMTVNFTDTNSGLIIGQYRCYIPSAFVAPTSVTGCQLASSGTGYFYRSLTANSTCTVSLNNALTAGSIRVALSCGTTSLTS